MKHWIIYLVLVLLPLPMLAQNDLAIGRVLDGRYKKNAHTTDVEISSKRLEDYQLVYYHSLTIEADTELMDIVSEAFRQDQAKAIDKELVQREGHIYYGFCLMNDDPADNHYVFFKDMRYAPDNCKSMLTLIYMEGPASMQFLKRRFQQK